MSFYSHAARRIERDRYIRGQEPIAHPPTHAQKRQHENLLKGLQPKWQRSRHGHA